MFYMKTKIFGSFAPTPSPGYHPGPPGKLTAPPDTQLQSFLASSKTDVPIFFLCYLLIGKDCNEFVREASIKVLSFFSEFRFAQTHSLIFSQLYLFKK